MQLNLSDLNHELVLFGVFNILVVVMLALDLGLLNKSHHREISVKRAGVWTMIWFAVSMLFAMGIYLYDTDPAKPGMNETKTLEFIAAYLLEKSLSVDNLFVFIMIFQKFRIGPDTQPEILKWGIIGAVILRAIMILGGAALVTKFSWVLYVFGFFLLYTAWKMFAHKEEEEIHPEKSFIFRIIRKFIPIAHHTHPHQFFTVENGKRVATHLFIVLVLVETSDVMFALDSIPAVFSVSQDPFIVYTSNIFAILGLRSMYFMISGIMDLFIHLKTGVAVILAFVGGKMILPLACELIGVEKIHVPITVSLAAIISILVTSILFSWPEFKRKKRS